MFSMLILKVPCHASSCGVIGLYKPFWKSAPYDITDGRVHLDVCWVGQSTSLPNGLQQTLLICPSPEVSSNEVQILCYLT